MQFSVPQFIEVEDKIIGPLTLKQFLILLFGGLICLMFWSMFKLSFAFFALALPTAGLFALLAFGRFNGRPLMSSVLSFLNFYRAPKVRVFQRSGEGAGPRVVRKASPAEAQTAQKSEEQASRLRRLAYLLDQKTAEEERLIHSGQMKAKWLNQL